MKRMVTGLFILGVLAYNVATREGEKIMRFLLSILFCLSIFLGFSTACKETNEDLPQPPDDQDTAAEACTRSPLPQTGQIIQVSHVAALYSAIDTANAGSGVTLMLADGTYYLDDMLVIRGSRITVRSQSGQRDRVILRGQGMHGNVTHIFNVTGSNFTAADLTLGWVANHAVQIHSSASTPRLHNLHIVDTGEQMVKVSYVPGSAESSADGILEWSLLEYSAGVGPQYYIGGIDAHQTANWIVRHNIFRYIRSPDSDVAEHAVHFWSGSRGTLVEHNLIVDCDRGIGFGLGDRAHHQGMIRNNMIYVTRDVGIGLESCDGAEVYHNTVFAENYPWAIEYRFTASRGNRIVNNLCFGLVISRDGGAAESLANIENALPAWFVDPRNGNLRLSSAIAAVVDQGLVSGNAAQDFDCEARPKGSAPDIGADEF